ncbi:MAG TPA: glycine betaine ABC transporter substrate-binding protein [Solirubrobacterales bacterium]|nr:glycine betaine ABC transporter substrate-binding protein [Solirubrobacterales bacterium]
MTTKPRLRALLALFGVLVLTLGLAACGSDDSDDETGDGNGGSASAEAIVASPDNEDVSLTIGSKNFTEQIVLGEIYAQALSAAGYDVETDLNLGSEQIALQALENGAVDAYPEYTSTALTSFFELPAQDVPKDVDQAYEDTRAQLADLGLTAFAPTPFTSANAVGLLRETAEEYDLETISDLEGVSEELTLNGSPECRQRVDCLLGLQRDYGLEFAEFNPVDIGLRYQVLDNGTADLSILFTTDAQLAGGESEYVLLEDDQEVFPPGNVMMIASEESVEQAGPDFKSTVELVQGDLTEEVMQELNARVDVDQQTPAQTAREYLEESGYIE